MHFVRVGQLDNSKQQEFINLVKQYNIQRLKGISHENAERFCRKRRVKLRQNTDCCKNRHLVIPALRQKLNLDPSDAGMQSVKME